MFPILSGVAMGQGPAAFAVTIANDSPAGEIFFQSAGNSATNPPDLDFTVTASGGSGSYTFAWTLNITDDGQGCFSVNTQGNPRDQAQYDSAVVASGTSRGAPGTVNVSCVVSDGVATDITVTGTDILVIPNY